MFGAFRFFLAWLVVAAHLVGTRHAAWNSSYAVFAFYLLSGFLMTQVLNSTYRNPLRGTLQFLANRALRIYPPYLAVMLPTALFVALEPALASSVNPSLVLPASLLDWLRNLFILGLQPSYSTPRLVPPGWSLHVELIFYCGMALGLSRQRTVSAAWFVASLAYTAYMLSEGYRENARYFPVAAASLPFSTGAVLFHWRERLAPWVGTRVLAVAVACFGLNLLLPSSWVGHEMRERFYLSLALAAVVVVALSRHTQRNGHSSAARLDRLMGDLSYPIFLSHILVAGLLERLLLLGPGILNRSPALVLACAVPILAFSWGLHRLVEVPVEALRSRLRSAPPSEP